MLCWFKNMLVSSVQNVIPVLLLIMKACAHVNSVLAFDSRHSLKYVKEEYRNSVPLEKFYNCRVCCEAVRLLTNPMLLKRINYAKNKESVSRKRSIQQSLFVRPIEDWLKNVKRILFPQRFNNNWQDNTQFNEQNQLRKITLSPYDMQDVTSTTSMPLKRKLSSIVTGNELQTVSPLSRKIGTKSKPFTIIFKTILNKASTVPISLSTSPSSREISPEIEPVTKTLKTIRNKASREPNAIPFTTTKSKSETHVNFYTTNTSIQGPNIVEPCTVKVTRINVQENFADALNQFERRFYAVTSSKLFSISPLERRENGISFVESSLFLFLILNALSVELDKEAKSEIDSSLNLHISDLEKTDMIQRVISNLPASSSELKFHWSSQLVVNGSWSPALGAGDALHLRVDQLHANQSDEQLLNTLNHMVEQDSGGAMRNTFEEGELVGGARAILIQTMYLRARWRVAATLLNGTRPFRDADGAPPRATRMLRINDVMRYADLRPWDAQAVEISYSTPGLSVVLIVPRGRSLRALSKQAATCNADDLAANMRTRRVAVTLPIYTLRMTLLLANKLKDMGISELLSPKNNTYDLRISHAVQRLMFWAEAGRNAYKDDGIEWDPSPDLEMMVDRPYLFYVRWQNLTLMNGHFVL